MAVLIAGAIGAVLTTIGAIGAAAFITSSFGVALVAVGLGVGLTLVGGLLQRGQSPTQKPSDGQQAIKQPLAARTRSYGRVRVSGVVWWMAADNATPSTLYYGLAINHGVISSFVSFHIDENQVDLDVNDKVTTTPYSVYNTYLQHRLGNTPETRYDDLFTVFGIDNIRGDGVTSILSKITNPSDVTAFTKTYPNGRPLIRATINATPVWDPRDASQVLADPSTYVWSDNSVLCLLHYLLNADGYGMPYDRIAPNITEWIEAADICDEQIPLAAGNIGSRYRCAGTYALTDNPTDVVARFESTCDGRLWQKRDGSIGISVGKFKTPTVTLTPADIIGYTEMMYGQDPVKSIAGVRAQYMSPDHDYREHESEPWPNADAVLRLVQDRIIALDLLWVPNNAQARRLQKRAYIRATAVWRGTITTNLGGMQALDERWINITLPELAVNRSFEIEKLTYDRQTGICEFQVRSVDASIDNWVASEEGTAEAQTLAIDATFNKIGTTFDALGEGGATFGQTVVVFAENAGGVSGLPTIPTGWTRQFSVLNANNYNSAVYWKVIDGTEVLATFNAVSGPITAFMIDQLPNPQFNLSGQYEANVSQGGYAHTFDLTGISAPFIFFSSWGLGGSDFDSTNPVLETTTPNVTILDTFIQNRSAPYTLNVAAVVYGSNSVVPEQIRVSDANVSVNVIQSVFTMEPG